MTIRIASVVELGSPDLATVLGINPFLAAALEAKVLDKMQITRDRFRLTLTYDNRIMIEKEFLPLATVCQCALCKQMRENDRALQEEVIPPNVDFPHAICMEDMHEPPEEAK